MAKFNPQRLKPVEMDGERFMAPEFSTIGDVVSADVNAVTVYNPSGGSQLIPRSQFNRPLPEGFTTHLTHVEKGGGERFVLCVTLFREVH